MASLKDLRLPNWTFYYETELQHRPFQFMWKTEAEKQRQMVRRPDGVAWNPVLGRVIFLEFTRAMDNPENMTTACMLKGRQYAVPMRALQQAQQSRELRHSQAIHSITTSPLIFGVRGTVLMKEAREGLAPMELTEKQLKTVLASGVRAAITAASEMCAARFAALRSVPVQPRGPDGKRVKVIIPPKPFRQQQWRADRGGSTTMG